jgi:branched-chain amino acid transport system permease protein
VKDLIQMLVSGLSAGSIYALMALGMAVIYRSTTVLNFAQGEVFMLGGFIALIAITVLGLSYAWAFVIALLGVFLIGAVIDKVAFQPLLHADHLSQVFATVGLLFIIRGGVRYFQADQERLPGAFGTGSIEIGGASVNPQHLLIIGALIVATVVFAVLFNRTYLGRIMRASTQSLRGCALVGINLRRVFALMWATGALLAGLAGVLAGPILLVGPDMGHRPLLMGLAGMTLGGFGSLPGAVAGGLLIGLAEVSAGMYVSTRLGDAAGFIIVFLVLLLRPRGLFSTKGIA